MGQITRSPIFWIGIVLAFIGFVLIIAMMTLFDIYRVRQVKVEWWLYAIAALSFAAFIIGLNMIVMAIGGADIARNVTSNVKTLINEAELITSSK